MSAPGRRETSTDSSSRVGRRGARWRAAIAALAGALVVAVPGLAGAAPPAGTVIGNQASAEYRDAANTLRTATSNLVQTTVTQVKSFTLAAPGARTAAAGQTVYYPHTITNTGNGTDTYALNAPATGGAFTHTGPGPGPVYYLDADGNGVPDNFTAITTSGPLAAGAIFRFVVAGTVPGGTASALVGTMTVSVTDTNAAPVTLSNVDSTTVANSAVSVTKSLSATSGPSPNAGPITVTLSYTNTGSAAATNLVLRDLVPAGMAYLPNSGRWSVTGPGVTLTDPDLLDQGGIVYDYGLSAANTVTATIANVPAGFSGTLTFGVAIAAGLAPGFVNNTANFQTATQAGTNTNTASYQVLRVAEVVANGSTANSTNGTGEPVTIASAAAGSAFSFTNVIWNRGNAPDTFVISMAGQGSWPPGSTFTLLQADGATSLIANTTTSIPVWSGGCPAGFEADAANQRCGYRVILRVQLPVAAAGGPYSITKTATSSFDSTKSDTVEDRLTVVAGNSVDVTNDSAGAAAPGAGATGTTVITTNTVTPSTGGPVVTRFRLYVNNTGSISDSFNLSVGPLTPVPAGWSVAFLADGGAGDCSTVGAALANTGTINAGAALLVCAEVTVPAIPSGQAAPGNRDFDFFANSPLNPCPNPGGVCDIKRDRVTVVPVASVTLAPDNVQQTVPGGSVTYTHVLTNLGNAAETVTFAAGFLADSRAAQGWTSVAYLDGNGNGVFEPGVDDVPGNQVTTATTIALAVNASRTIFVRVVAPAGALGADPANVTTLTARYNAGAGSVAATDTTSVIGGLVLLKEHRTVNCDGSSPGSFTTAAIPAGPATAPGLCVQYRVTATNTSAANLANVVISDGIPAGTRQENGCGAPATSAGSIASPGAGNTGTIVATFSPGPLAPSAAMTMTFCARIDTTPAPPAGSVIANTATATALQGATPLASTSNTVPLTVGGTTAGGYAFVLLGSTQVVSTPGAQHDFPHTLTNTGTLADSYQLLATDLVEGFAFASVALYPDANGDGIADGAVPVAGPIALAPGQSFRFVVRVTVPLSPASFTLDSVEIRATSAGGARTRIVRDTVRLADPTVLPDCASVVKRLSAERGPSPAGPLTVTLNYAPCDQPRSRLVIKDLLPAGMRYVAGSGRWSGAPDLPLTDAVVGDDWQGGGARAIAYDYGATAAGTVTATVRDLPADSSGWVSFQVEIAPGLAKGTRVDNEANYVFYDAQGNYGGGHRTNVASYHVLDRVDLRLEGDRIPVAMPGEAVTFRNRLTNLGDQPDRFDVSLAGSTFPPGTVLALFQSDGVTPLADTDGNGSPDTGLVASGGVYWIVVRAVLPATTLPGEYRVTKTARSARGPLRSESADDVLGSVGRKCHVELTPDNQSQSAYGRHVTYVHYLENRGNCEEPVRVLVGFLADSLPGWVSAAFIDNPVAGGASIPGVLDPTDTPVTAGWTALLGPGQGLRVLVDVLAPPAPGQAGATAATTAKALVASNLTTLTIDSTSGGALKVVDRTMIDDQDASIVPEGVIRNFTDATYRVATAWGVLGGTAWLRADAQACNADATAAETRVVVVTGPNGEREEVVATETGPDTGIFVAPALPIRAPPVAAGDRALQGRAFDVLDAEILGCGRRIATTVTLTEPAGVVFDSGTNEPVAGAGVALVPAAGGQCGTAAVALEGNPATTDAAGRFAFPAAPGADYCLVVSPPNGYAAPSKVPYAQLVPGRNLVVTGPTSGGSYGQPFRSDGNGIVVDVPVDPAGQSGLFVQKAASRQVVDLGGFVDYAVRVRNGTGNALDRASVQLVDDLPAGFAYVAGSVRAPGRAVAEPAGGGPRLVFGLGALATGQEATLTYRVRVGPGALQGDGTNRAQARYTAGGATTLSNVATAKVQVIGGVFSDRGFILGKVFLDCNANGEQDAGEAGVPGVRLVIQDGTYVVTDGQGRYSFYGLPNRTHALKVDRTTLPPGARLAATSARHLGDAGSRIVDLKAGEMHRGDFAIAGCDAPLVEDVKARAKASGEDGDPLATLAGTQLATEARLVQDVKSLPASGVVSPTGQPTGGTLAPDAPAGSSRTNAYGAIIEVPGALRPTPAPALPPARSPAVPAVSLESLVPGLDPALGFVGLKEGDTLPAAQATIRVKGTAGATIRLAVNGTEVPEARIGKRATLAEKQVQALEFVGVEMKPGANELVLSQADSFGNARGTVTIRVHAPGKGARLVIEPPAGGAVADGRTLVRVVVKVLDANGAPVAGRTPVTLASSAGLWKVEDPDPAEPGVQAFVEGGRGEFPLAPPLEPASTVLVATSGPLRAEARLDFLPELRPLVATGILEGVVNMRNINSRALVPTREADGFERELRHLSREWNDGKGTAGARAAFFLKGKIKGDFLLTAAYDSDKDTRERLFRDIQPDEFYPVYGDSAVRGYDAQSTSRLYVRIDSNRSYLLWGDFTTQAEGDLRRLSNYSRSLTGAKVHHETERVRANAFATRDTTRQVIDELRANGTSGPYELSTRGALVNSEKVEIVTRDRNQPSIVIASLPQSRFTDYEIEPLTGRILFRSPVASVDRDLNPVFVRVTYEVDQGGEEFWVAGVDAQVKLTERIEVGGTYVKDENPQAPFTLAGANAVAKLGEGTYVIGEVARTENGPQGARGDAARLEVRHDSKDLKAQAFVARSDREFNNPGAWLNSGRSEAGGRAEYRVREGTLARVEALRTEDVASGAVRDGAMAAVTQEVARNLTLEVGMRYAAERGASTASPVPPVAGMPAPQPMPDEVTTVRARLTGQVPFLAGANVYGEAEVDVTDADRRILALGGEYTLPNRGRLYARHEFVSSITGPYGLNATERQNTTAVGVDFDYMRDGRLFSEYRIRDAMAGGDAEAAIGLKNLWTLAPGLRLGTSLERVHALSGTGQNENTAGAVALEYTANPLWKGTTRLELRDSSTTESLLFTVGLAARLNRDWTALARNAYSLQRAKDGTNERVVERLQAGLAWRDTQTNLWNALGRVEHRLEQDDTQAGLQLKASTTIVSLNADWQPRRPFLVTGRYAAKWTTDKSNGLASRYRAQVIGGRATWEFAPRWDIGFIASLLVGDGTDSRHYGVGLELGYLVTTNLWVSAGYNLFGYRDADLAGADYTARGPYVRLRYKFDEDVLGGRLSESPGTPALGRPAGQAAASRPAVPGAYQPVAPGAAGGAGGAGAAGGGDL